MQSLRLKCCRDSLFMNSLSGPFEIHRKSSPSSPNSRIALSLRKDFHVESRHTNLCGRKPSSKSQSFQEKKERWRELHDDLKKTKAEKLIAFDELERLKKTTKMNEDFEQNIDRIKMLEKEAMRAKESERKMLESLISQTKHLEQTKILLEEAKLEIRTLHGNPKESQKQKSLEYAQSEEQIRKLKNELNSALWVEEKSRKAMDDLVFALKEVTVEVAQAKSELSSTKSHLEISESLLQIAEKDMKKKNEEISNLKEQLSRKEDELQSSIAREMKTLLESKNSSKVSDFESLRLSEREKDDGKIGRNVKKFSSDRWPCMNPAAGRNAQRHPVELALDKEGGYGNKDAVFGSVFDATDNGLPPFLFAYDKETNTDDSKHLCGKLFSEIAGFEKKKTSKRFGEPFRRSFGKY